MQESEAAILGDDDQPERSLEENLERLRAHRKRDPEFKAAMAAFVQAELSEDDPAEGMPVRGQFVAGQFVEAERTQKNS